MERFVVFTRGRTGSSAICDELDAYPEISCHQELFRLIPEGSFVRNSWEQHGIRCFEPNLRKQLGVPDRVLPFDLFLESEHEPLGIEAYYKYLERAAASENSRVLGHKMLTRHFDDRCEYDMFAYLRAVDTKVLYLARRDPVREAISGGLARARGFFSIVEGEPAFQSKIEKMNRTYSVNCTGIVDEVKYIAYWTKEWTARLQDAGFDYLNIYYEDFVENRIKFHRAVLDYLGLFDLRVSSQATNYMKISPINLRECIQNYGELGEALAASGFELRE